MASSEGAHSRTWRFFRDLVISCALLFQNSSGTLLYVSAPLSVVAGTMLVLKSKPAEQEG